MIILAVQNDEKDIIKLSGNTLTINGVAYDLTNPKPLKVLSTIDTGLKDLKGDPIIEYTYESSEDNRVYLDGDETIIRIHYPHNMGFMFRNTAFTGPDGKKYYGSNYLRFFDKNLNNIIDGAELENLIEWYNLKTEKERQDYLRPIYEAFEGSKMDWKMSGCLEG